jgi:L-aspartate oxidase
LQTTKHLSSFVLSQAFSSIDGWELQNLLTVALMMSTFALARQESRGVHLRTDFPKLDEVQWRKHLTVTKFSQCL